MNIQENLRQLNGKPLNIQAYWKFLLICHRPDFISSKPDPQTKRCNWCITGIPFPHYIHLSVTPDIGLKLCFQVEQNTGCNLQAHLKTHTLPKYLLVTGTSVFGSNYVNRSNLMHGSSLFSETKWHFNLHIVFIFTKENSKSERTFNTSPNLCWQHWKMTSRYKEYDLPCTWIRGWYISTRNKKNNKCDVICVIRRWHGLQEVESVEAAETTDTFTGCGQLEGLGEGSWRFAVQSHRL